MAADGAIDWAMIEAGAAADAAEHVLEIAAKHLAPPVVEQDDVVGARPVRVSFARRPGGEGGVGGDFLAGA